MYKVIPYKIIIRVGTEEKRLKPTLNTNLHPTCNDNPPF